MREESIEIESIPIGNKIILVRGPLSPYEKARSGLDFIKAVVQGLPYRIKWLVRELQSEREFDKKKFQKLLGYVEILQRAAKGLPEISHDLTVMATELGLISKHLARKH